MTKPDWLGLEDLPDPVPKPCTVEQDQVEYLQEHLGLVLWAALCEREDDCQSISKAYDGNSKR